MWKKMLCMMCINTINCNTREEALQELKDVLHKNQGGFYCENQEEFNKGFIINGKLYYLGVIKKISLEECLMSLDQIQETFPEFTENKMFSPIMLQEVINFLSAKTQIAYTFSIAFNRKGEVQLIIKPQPTLMYFIKRIEITGNKVLKKEEILDCLSSILCKFSWMEKIKFILSSYTGALVTGAPQIRSAQQAIKDLAQKHLMDCNVEINCKLMHKRQEAIMYIHVEERDKFFIGSMTVAGPDLSKEVSLIILEELKEFVKSNGMKNNSFSYLEDHLLYEYDIPDVKVSHYYVNEFTINIVLERQTNTSPFIIESIIYKNISEIAMSFLSVNVPARMGEALVEWKIKQYCRLLTVLLRKNVTHKVTPLPSTTGTTNNIVLTIEGEANNHHHDLITNEKFNLILQYAYRQAIKGNPHYELIAIPKLVLNLPIWPLKVGGQLGLNYKFSPHMTLDCMNLSAFMNLKYIFQLEKIIQSLHLNVLHLNYKRKFQEYGVELLTVSKYYHPNMPNAFVDHIYYYSNLFTRKMWKVNSTLHTSLHGYGYLFYRPLTAKLGLNPEFIIKLNSKWNLLCSLRGLYNNQGYSNREYYNHLSTTNQKMDNMMGLLWTDYYCLQKINSNLSPNEILADQHYIYSKGIILSNLLFKGRIMLNREIFHFYLPTIGYIRLFMFLFMEMIKDVTYGDYYCSGGLGVMGTFQNSSILCSVGWRRKLQDSSEGRDSHINHEGLRYGFALENYSF